MRLRWSMSGLCLLCVVVAAVLLSWPAQPGVLRLGMVGSLSGRFAALGTTGRDGAQLAVEEINAAGGAGGRRIELIPWDDRGEGAACIAAYEAMASSGCRLAVGPFATGPATAALATIDRLQILTIAPTVAGDNFSGKDDWFLRLYPSTRMMGRMLATMAHGDGVRVLAVLGDAANGPFVSTTVEGLREAALAGLTLVERSFDSRQRESLSAVAADLGRVDAVLLVASSLDTAVLAQRLRERNPECRLLCSSWAVSKELIANGGRAVDGMRTVLPVALDGTAAQTFSQNYRARFGEEPSHVALLHHEAVHLLAAAITTTGSTDPAVLRRALTTEGGVRGAPAGCQLDPYGDPRRELVPHRIVAGRLIAEAGVAGR